jgi:HlyD family secretion protein
VSVSEVGHLIAVKQTLVTNKLSGDSKIIFVVPEGTMIKKGDLLVELDAEGMRQEVKQLEIEVESSKLEFEEAKNNLLVQKSTNVSDLRSADKEIRFAEMDLVKFTSLGKAQELRDAESAIATAKDSYKLAEQRYSWTEKLAGKGFETKSQKDRDLLDLKGRQIALESAQNKLKMLKNFELPKTEAELQSKLDEAKETRIRLEKQGNSKLKRAESQVATSERKLKLKREQLDAANKRLSQSKLFAPVDGIALYVSPRRKSHQPHIQKGAVISQNRNVIVIPGLSNMKLNVEIPEFYINRIKEDLPAIVSIDSRPGEKFTGVVSKVASLPHTKSSWLDTGQMFYTVEVLITEKLEGVKPSISAKCEIVVADLENVISIPLHAVREEKGELFCYVKDAGRFVKHPVTLGLMNDTFVEITQGLDSGDEVLLGRAPKES